MREMCIRPVRPVSLRFSLVTAMSWPFGTSGCSTPCHGEDLTPSDDGAIGERNYYKRYASLTLETARYQGKQET